MRIRIRLFTLMRIRILLLIKVKRICDHLSTVNPRPSILSLTASIVNVYSPPWLHFVHLQVLILRIQIQLFPISFQHRNRPPYCVVYRTLVAQTPKWTIQLKRFNYFIYVQLFPGAATVMMDSSFTAPATRSFILISVHNSFLNRTGLYLVISVAEPNPHVSGPPVSGSGSNSTQCRSGSSYNQAKLVRKNNFYLSS
jgi:hypothetical protein